MGTLFNQQPRKSFVVEESDCDFFLSSVVRLSQKFKMTTAEILEAYKILEMERKNNLFVWDGDAFDEQLAGFGELIQSALNLFEQTIDGGAPQ